MRPRTTSPLGKFTARAETVVPEETKEALNAMAWAADMTPAEYLRDLIIGHVHGYSMMMKMAQRGHLGNRGTVADDPELTG